MSRLRLPRSRVCLIGLALTLLAAASVLVARAYAIRASESASFMPLDADADWEGDWEISERGADPSEAGSLAGTDRVTLQFTGPRLALTVRRGNYRANLWVSVDGEPANLLPRTERGAYLVLTSPDCQPQVATIPVASGLHSGFHVAQIVADRGWDQWPLVGWCVSRGPDPALYSRALRSLSALAILCLLGVTGWGEGERCRQRPARSDAERTAYQSEGRMRPGRWLDPGFPASGEVEGEASDGLSAGIPAPSARLAQSGSLILVTLVAGVFYVSPWLPLTLTCGATLAALIILRPDLGPALVALTAPFYLDPRPLFGKSFSMVEIATLLCLLSWAVRLVLTNQRGLLRSLIPTVRALLARCRPPSTIDKAVLFLALTAAISTCFAAYRHVALRELRVVILEPALLYMILRTTRLGRKAVWRVVDALVLGAVAVAIIGLIQYILDINVITAEQGFRRLRSVYGSPNNAALYLGRALPMLLAGALLAARRGRRIAYAMCAVLAALATLLTFSRGALLLGVPLSLLVMVLLAASTDGARSFFRPGFTTGERGLLAKRRRWLWIVLGLIVVTAVGVIGLLGAPRFAGTLNPRSGTLFFRLQLWHSSWQMFLDHPWLGVGPDNFLYQYRGRYILPSAWQEPHLSHPHNLLLSYATRLGIVGLVICIWLQVGFWRRALAQWRGIDRDLRTLALGLMGSMAYTLGHGLVDASTFFVDLAFAFLLTLGLVQWLPGSDIYEQKD